MNTAIYSQPITWIRTFTYLPHCINITQYAQLKDGIAIAQLISQLLPQNLRPNFLKNIRISNLNEQASINNINYILNVLNMIGWNSQNKFTAEQIFQDITTLKRFIKEVKYFYEQRSVCSIKAKESVVRDYRGLQELSEIIQAQNVYVNTQPKITVAKQIKQTKPKALDFEQKKQKDQKELKIEGQKISMEQIQQLQMWLYEQFRINIGQPHIVMAQVVNNISSSRLNPEKIIKNIHYSMGAMTIWEKVCDYLLSIQRIKKQNILFLVQNLKEKEIVLQSTFWKVIQDVKLYCKGKNKAKKRSKKNSKHECQENYDPNDVDRDPNLIRQKFMVQTKSKKTLKAQNSQKNFIVKPVSVQIITEAQKWIDQLGYVHSLEKSKQFKENELKSPLLNGNLIGSILMRLQIGKPILIKDPSCKKEVIRNLEQLIRICIGRGYTCTKNLLKFRSSYDKYLQIVWMLKDSYDKHRQAQRANRVVKKIEVPVIQISQNFVIWLKEVFDLDIEATKQIDSNDLTRMASELLKLNLCRETTSKIQEQNLVKILEQVRKMGLSKYYNLEFKDLLGDEGALNRLQLILDLYTVLT